VVGRLRRARVPGRVRALPSHEGRLRERALTRIAVAAALLVALAALVAAGLTDGLDSAVLTLVQIPHARWLDQLGSFVTVGGDVFVTAGIAAGLVAARLWTRRPEALVPLAIVAVDVIELALKALVPHAAPPHELSRAVPVIPTLQAPVPFAFPSGHVARLTFLLAIGAIPARLSAVLIALMSISRLYLADHWLTDVLGGVLLGLAVAWAARAVSRRIVRVATRENRAGPAPQEIGR
jgi:undecaprenyl-diphosphatase